MKMVKYIWELCEKEFSQKSHYDSHNCKTPCKDNAIVKVVEEKKELIIENEKVNINTDIKTKQTKELNRNTIDKYYTKDIVVDLCLKLFKNYIHINTDDLIVEPSAGNGSFITGIKSLSSNFRFYDLEPNNKEIIKQDYLIFDYNNIKKTFSKIHIIGNPPFGR